MRAAVATPSAACAFSVWEVPGKLRAGAVETKQYAYQDHDASVKRRGSAQMPRSYGLWCQGRLAVSAPFKPFEFLRSVRESFDRSSRSRRSRHSLTKDHSQIRSYSALPRVLTQLRGGTHRRGGPTSRLRIEGRWLTWVRPPMLDLLRPRSTMCYGGQPQIHPQSKRH
jgi:hypothetical protein